MVMTQNKSDNGVHTNLGTIAGRATIAVSLATVGVVAVTNDGGSDPAPSPTPCVSKSTLPGQQAPSTLEKPATISPGAIPTFSPDSVPISPGATPKVVVKSSAEKTR